MSQSVCQSIMKGFSRDVSASKKEPAYEQKGLMITKDEMYFRRGV